MQSTPAAMQASGSSCRGAAVVVAEPTQGLRLLGALLVQASPQLPGTRAFTCISLLQVAC